MKIDKLTRRELLKTPVCDLNLRLPSPYRGAIKVLYSLLQNKGLRWKPHYWLSDEWYSPDGIGGFAIPFTLAHPKLRALEKYYLGYCEGESKREFFKLCAHETGHAIDNAFRLRLKKRRQRVFGLSSKTYPKFYVPRVDFDNYVTHLKGFYAQAHPEEDWAETFAVWLSYPNWRKRYRGKAYEKLACVESIISRLEKPVIQSKSITLPYQQDTRTIEEYFETKREQLNEKDNYFNQKVNHQFGDDRSQPSAYFFMKRYKANILANVSELHPENPWLIEKCYEDLAKECKRRKYRLKYNSYDGAIEKIIRENFQEYIRQGRARIYM